MKYAIRHKISSAQYGNALHYHDHYEAFYSLSGNILYSVEGRQYELSAGTLLLISPFEFHQLSEQSGGYTERIGLRFDGNLLKELSTPEYDLSACFDTSAPSYSNLYQLSAQQKQEVDYIFQRLLNEQNGMRFGNSLVEQAFLTQFFLLINRVAIEGAQLAPIFDPATQLVRQILTYMEQHYGETITLALLEKEFYVSRYQITRDFKRLVGSSPYHYLLQKRLQHAQRLLQSGLPPQETAAQCGFSDYSNFYRQFKKVYKVSPRAYSKKFSLNPLQED